MLNLCYDDIIVCIEVSILYTLGVLCFSMLIIYTINKLKNE